MTSRRWLGLLPLMLGLVGAVPVGRGQDAMQLSLAGAAAAEAQHKAANTVGYYNLRLGDVSLRVTSGLGLQYNDNVYLQERNPQGDFIFTPSLDTQIHSALTEYNSLDISLGVGYSAYVNHPDLSQFFLTPGSGLSFNLYAGDFVINLHDRISMTQNGYQNPSANGNGVNSTLDNTLGTAVTWDLNQMILVAGYDHGNYVSLGSGLTQPDSATENLFLSAGVKVRPEFTAGLEAGASVVTYNQSDAAAYPDTTQWSTGGFGELQVSENISTALHAGYSSMQPKNTATNLNISASSGLYFDLSLTHRVNRLLTYTLSAGRSQDLQSYGEPEVRYEVRWTPNWNLFHHFTVSTPFWWMQGTPYYYQVNRYEQYGGGLNIGRQITEKLSAAVAYQYVQETATAGNLNYIVNIISLNFFYRF